MAAKSFTVNLPTHILATFGWNESEASRRISETLVMELLRLDRLTEAEAAAMLGLDRWALLDVMAAHQVPAVSLSPDEWDAERARRVTPHTALPAAGHRHARRTPRRLAAAATRRVAGGAEDRRVAP